MKSAAFQATIHGFRTVPSRGVVSITIEAPIEQHAELAKIAVHGAWVAVARLRDPETAAAQPRQDENKNTAGAKRDWRDLSPQQQAGIRCAEPIFAAFLKECRPDDWHEAPDAAECVRLICGVQSRSELATNQKARVIWKQLDDQFSAWKALEHA